MPVAGLSGGRILLAILAAIIWGVGLTSHASAQSSPPVFARSEVTIATADGRRHLFHVEVATTADQQAYGLMFRRQLPPDAGMLFDYGHDRVVSMWMKNTLIPLDMVFIRGDGRIANIVERAVPGSLEPRSSEGRVRGVLELNGGTADRLGLKPGDRILHPSFGN